MAWSATRRATSEDSAKLERIAERFAERHGIPIDADGPPGAALTVALAVGDRPRLNRLWLRCVRRAFGAGVDGIAYGYIGSHVD